MTRSKPFHRPGRALSAALASIPALLLAAGLLAAPLSPAMAAVGDEVLSGGNIVDEGAQEAAGVKKGAPPAGRFESGGGMIREVRMDPSDPTRYLGAWRGPFAPLNMRYFEVDGPPVGEATLTITDVQGNLARGIIRWEMPGQDWAPQKYLGAFTRSGHIMVLNAHAIMYQQDHQRYIEADMMLPDGKYYRLRMSRIE